MYLGEVGVNIGDVMVYNSAVFWEVRSVFVIYQQSNCRFCRLVV